MRQYIDEERIFPIQIIRCSQGSDDFIRLAYSGRINSFYGPGGSGVSYLNALNEEIDQAIQDGNTGFLIVTEHKDVARKAAMYINNRLRCAKEPDVSTDIFGEELPEEMTGEITRMIRENCNTAVDGMDEVTLRQPVVDTSPMDANLLCTTEDSSELILGLESGDCLEDKLEAIRSYRGKYRFVWITPEQENDPQICALEMACDYRRMTIPELRDSDYAELLEALVKKTGGRLKKGHSYGDIVTRLRQKCGEDFSEECVDGAVQQAIRRAMRRGEKKRTLQMEDFFPESRDEISAHQKLERLIGLDKVKRIVAEAEALCKELQRNPKLKETGMHSDMIFCGNPGTGKTTVAELLAKCLGEAGVSNGVFISVGRRDLEGKYVGHTAPKVADAFKRARGGVLFVDEAGFMTQTINGSGRGYTAEIVKEFVRYMELMPDVTVIFGMYDREAEDFLQLDNGLRSRISRVVRFEDFGDDELARIASLMFTERGYRMEKGGMSLIMEYLLGIRGREDYGNAREVRRIVENAIRAHCLEKHEDPNVISVSEIRTGIRETLTAPRESTPKKRRIGFAAEEAEPLAAF
ncbi:MAG: AAA family ATPase [Lachnospiraceae bacterium]|nr:AAA family ATPase [Lachnospiraceae bacterium]